jgi:cytosine/adenosine deaminase-related metal-dependent hydrolase
LKSNSVLIEDGIIVTMDPGRRVIREGSVMIEEGKISEVGESKRLRQKHRPESRISAKGKAVIPGLIDTHVHLAQGLLRGAADDLSLVEWLRDRIWPLQGNYTSDDGRVSAQLSMLEMMKSGTTSFVGVDVVSRYGFQGIAEAVSSAGMRGALAKTIMDSPGYGTKKSIMHPGLIEEKEACMSEARTMSKAWNSIPGGLVKIWLAPRSLGGCSKQLYEDVGAVAKEDGLRVTMHLAEVKEDVKYARKNYDATPVEFIERVGLKGPHVLFAHMVWLNEGDMSRLAQSKTNVAHCPASNLKLASGVPKVPEMINSGINIGLGCDGAPCNNSYDMIREMKLAALIQKARLLDPKVMPAATVLAMATINGAKAVGLEKDIGSIEKGKRADLAIIDLRKPHLVPFEDVVSTIVYSASGADVDSVLIGGKFVVKDGVAQTLDERTVLDEAEAHRAEVMERAGIKS